MKLNGTRESRWLFYLHSSIWAIWLVRWLRSPCAAIPRLPTFFSFYSRYMHTHRCWHSHTHPPPFLSSLHQFGQHFGFFFFWLGVLHDCHAWDWFPGQAVVPRTASGWGFAGRAVVQLQWWHEHHRGAEKEMGLAVRRCCMKITERKSSRRRRSTYLFTISDTIFIDYNYVYTFISVEWLICFFFLNELKVNVT